MDQTEIQTLVRQCALGLFDLACAVSGHPEWDLSLPVGVIDARRTKPKLMVTAVGTINSMVKASSTIGHPLMKRFFERFSALGLDEALREARQQDHSGAFEEIWLTYREERRSGEQAMWSIEDATAFVLQSKEAHTDREISCVAILPGDPHRILTFSVPIAFLTHPGDSPR
ncbi:MAG: hypothetical protein CMN96_07455 [Synechococcus sp. MED850]|jgi:hypothetical protein|nr:hypothetical protein [Synechococcus sp. MED850]